MAGQPASHTRDPARNCIIMHDDDSPLVSARHVIDAFVVAAIVFFAVLLGDALLVWWNGGQTYLTAPQVEARVLTAGIAFGLTFFFQWARSRGLDVLEFISRVTGGG